MIEKINILNFRGFQKLEVDNLKQVNVLVGQNSSGKSAFLESIFFSSSANAPAVSLQLRALRRMGNQLANPIDTQSYRGVWEDLFFNFRDDKKLSIKVTGQPVADTRTLSVEYYQPLDREVPYKQSSASSGNTQEASGLPQIEFRWKKQGHPEVLARPKFTVAGLQFENSSGSAFECLWFTPGGGETPDENAKRFSALTKRGDIDVVKAAISKEFPFILDLSIQYHAGTPMMFASVEGKERMMPVALISDGINRLMGICLGISYYKGGTILIDQLEDGLHHSLLPSIWNSIYSLAKQFKVQLFISTHSRECLEALRPTINGREGDFCLLRASRDNRGCSIKSLSGEYLETALEQEFEVR